MLQSNQIYLGDCLSVMQEIEDKSVTPHQRRLKNILTSKDNYVTIIA